MPKTPKPNRPNANRQPPGRTPEEGFASPFWTTREAARYLRSSPRTLEKYRLEGGGPPFVKLGRKVLYEIAAVKRWAIERRRQSTSDPGGWE